MFCDHFGRTVRIKALYRAKIIKILYFFVTLSRYDESRATDIKK